MWLAATWEGEYSDLTELWGVFAPFPFADTDKLFQRLHWRCGQVYIVHWKSSAARELE